MTTTLRSTTSPLALIATAGFRETDAFIQAMKPGFMRFAPLPSMASALGKRPEEDEGAPFAMTRTPDAFPRGRIATIHRSLSITPAFAEQVIYRWLLTEAERTAPSGSPRAGEVTVLTLPEAFWDGTAPVDMVKAFFPTLSSSTGEGDVGGFAVKVRVVDTTAVTTGGGMEADAASTVLEPVFNPMQVETALRDGEHVVLLCTPSFVLPPRLLPHVTQYMTVPPISEQAVYAVFCLIHPQAPSPRLALSKIGGLDTLSPRDLALVLCFDSARPISALQTAIMRKAARQGIRVEGPQPALSQGPAPSGPQHRAEGSPLLGRSSSGEDQTAAPTGGPAKAQGPAATTSAEADEAAIRSACALGDYARQVSYRKFIAPHPEQRRGKRRKGQKLNQRPSAPPVQLHHIFPKALYPQFADKAWNLAGMFIPAHYGAHLALAGFAPEEPALSVAVSAMRKRFRHFLDNPDCPESWMAEERARAAASALQSKLRKKDWEDPAYRQKRSEERTKFNKEIWQDPVKRETRRKSIVHGRQTGFYSDPEAVTRATAAQAEKTRGKRHWKFKPVNIYDHKTGALVAEHICLREFAIAQGITQSHLQQTLTANRRTRARDTNRHHAGGYFARALRKDGTVIGDVAPARATLPHPNSKPANIYRHIPDGEDICVARGVIISQFCNENDLGIRFSQSALSRTAYGDFSKPPSKQNVLTTKGYYARYITPDAEE